MHKSKGTPKSKAHRKAISDALKGRKFSKARKETCSKAQRKKAALVPLKEKFWSRVDIKGKDECWEWTRGRLKAGYGQFRDHRTKEVRAHRVAWELTNGRIPKGAFMCHDCDNPPCCNPNHLHLGDSISNMKEKKERGRCQDQNGEKNPNNKLTENDVKNIRKLCKSGWTQKNVAKIYSLHPEYVGKIVRRLRWTHV